MSESMGLFDDSSNYPTSQDSYFYDEYTDPIGNLPINLDSLRDGPPGTKPFYPYSTLLRYAIKGSPNQKLLLEDIYYALESRFPYFKTAPSGWKNSIRHNLTLNPCFEKIARPLSDRGKGSYWIVNDNIDPRTGVHRVRKKKDKPKSPGVSEERDLLSSQPSFADPHGQQISPQVMQPNMPENTHYPPSAYATFSSYSPVTHGSPPYQSLGTTSQQQSAPSSLPFSLHPPGPFVADAKGNPDWRSTWAQDLQQLRDMTAQQDLAQADEGWYRSMFERLRAAFALPLQMSMPPPPPAISLPGTSQ